LRFLLLCTLPQKSGGGQDEDTDLQASAAVSPADGRAGRHPPTVFGSISLGFGRASEAAGGLLQSWAVDAQRRLRPLLPPRQ